MDDEPEELIEWQWEIDLMSPHQLLTLWRHQPPGRYQAGDEETTYILRRMSILSQEQPIEYQDATRDVMWQ